MCQLCSSWKEARSAAYSPVQRLSELRLAKVKSSAHWLILNALNTLPTSVVCLQLIMVKKSYTTFFSMLRFKSIYMFVSYTIPPGREELCCWEVEILPSSVNHLEGSVFLRELAGSFCLLDSSHSASIPCGIRVAMNPHQSWGKNQSLLEITEGQHQLWLALKHKSVPWCFTDGRSALHCSECARIPLSSGEDKGNVKDEVMPYSVVHVCSSLLLVSLKVEFGVLRLSPTEGINACFYGLFSLLRRNYLMWWQK